jgi:glycogen synthase
MRVLMFGWEFPPHITGGLGTACFGLTKGLVKHGIDVIFVVPKAFGDETKDGFRLVNASEVVLDFHQQESREFWQKIQYMEIGSNLVPYLDPEEFERITSQEVRTGEDVRRTIFSQRYTFSGKYGPNLMEEVSRYALVASSLAQKNTFDVIHAHDWLTYPAGIAAKEISGKPLVVHVHATEFDR